MLQRHISSLPVIEHERLVGIFTATDALSVAESLLATIDPAPRVEQLMTPRPLVTIAPDAPLSAAWRAMREHGVRHLPVLDGEALLGILSDHDVLAAGREWLEDAARADGTALAVADAMSKRVFTIDPEHEAHLAAHTLSRRRVGALPVMRGREIVGMLAVTDFLYWILARP
jgi:acetoin utilization protein AcuB